MVAENFILSSLQGRLGDFLESIFIFEGRIDFLKKQHEKGIDSSHDTLAKHREPHDIIDHFAANADPSKKKAYTQKIVDWYKNKEFRQEDHGRVRQTLKDFEANKNKLPHSKIKMYKSFHHLNSALADFKPKQTNMNWGEFSQDDLDHLNGKGSTVIHDEPKYTVREVHDQRAMDTLGKGTEWCVVSNKHRLNPESGVGADSSLFKEYKDEHPGSKYFHVHDKKTGERHLVHHESEQHMDVHDEDSHGHIAAEYSKGMSKTLNGLSKEDKYLSPYLHETERKKIESDYNLATHQAGHTSKGVQQRLIKDFPKVLASNRNTHFEVLHDLHNHGNREVKGHVAGNTSTHHETLHAMHTDPDLGGWAVAGNTSTHHETLHAMHTDPDRLVKRAVARNTSTHHKTLHAMIADESNPDDVRNRARENLKNRGLL